MAQEGTSYPSFLSQNTQQGTIDNRGYGRPMQNPKKKTGKLLGIISFLLFLLIVSIGAYFGYTKFIGNSDTTGVVQVTPEPTITYTDLTDFESSDSASAPATIDKTTVKVQVLNGTSVTGLAATVKTQLTSLGYTSVTTGNTPTNTTETTARFSEKIPQADRTEIITLLNKDFKTVSEAEASASAQFDVAIILGTKK